MALAASIALTAAVVGVLEARRIAGSVRTDAEATLHAQAVLLAELARPVLVRGEIDPGFQRRLVELGEASAVRLTVIADGGRVLADSHGAPQRMDDHGDRPEILALREGRVEAVVERRSRTVARELVYLARSVEVDGRRVGYVRTAKPVAEIGGEVSDVRANMLFGVLVAALASCGVALFIVRRLARPLHEMSEAVGAMASGDFSRRVRVGVRDEIGELAVACNSLAEQLSQRIDVLAKERQEVVATLRSMFEGVVATDEEQRVLFINDSARRMLSIDEDECAGVKIWKLTRVQGISAILEQTIAEDTAVAEEIRVRGNRSEQFLEARSSPLRSEHDLVRGAVVVFHDVTELRRLEKVRRDFVANVSHELKTPLTAVRGYVDTLLDDPDVEPAVRQRFLAKIRQQADRLNALVSDQLTLAKIESRDTPIDRRRIDVRDVIRASANLARERAAEKDIAVSVSIDERRVEVEGDPELLRQAADNLVDNAVKYTPAGGRVAVRLRSEGGAAILEVEDTGIGLSAEDCERVFERFYRVDRARSRELGGTGLGLSIVRNVAVAHGGDVSVKSELGRGSIFTVRLPIAPAEVPEAGAGL